MPPQRRLRTRIKQMDRIQLLEYVALSIVLVIALIAIIAAFTLSSMGGGVFRDDRNIIFDSKLPDTGLPLQDTDGDGLGDIEENYKYGTNITNPDTDGDGMQDGWEVWWMARDSHTGEWLLDPNDPTDAYSDPDNDGYDFDHNGYINGSEQDRTYSGYDWVFLSKLKVPAHSDYTTYNLNLLLSNLEEHKGELVRIPGARVVDNGTYDPNDGGFGTQIDRPIMISITDQSTSQQLMVCMTGRSNRPINLYDDNSGVNPADIVDVQGIFLGEGVDYRIECRGTEKFTNLMEYLATRDYNNDRNQTKRYTWNETNPLAWDTDFDGMSDGWEVHYGNGLLNTSFGQPRWEWIVKLDPTSPDDAWGESNPAMTDLDNDRIQVPDPETGEQKWVGYNRDEYLTIKDAELLRLLSPLRRNLADMLGIPDLNRSWYAYGMDPAMSDSDLDSYDVDNDGPTPGVDTNANDFNEIFYSNTNPINDDTDGDTMKDGWEIHYGLNATNPNDRFDDPDSDQLQNYMEFQSRTNPRRWDTDDEGNPRRDPNAIFDDPTDPACYDGMPDGWEVFYRLDPLNRNDWNHDDDVIDIAGVPVSRPDGLINLLEYTNNTDPKNPDTDGDHLSDYEEIAIGWDVRVNSRMEHYYTCASRYGGMDTDKDTSLGPGLPPEGTPPGPAGTEFLNPGDEDTRHDLNDWNEVVYYRTNGSNPDTDGDGLSDGTEMFTDLEPNKPGMQATDPCLIDTDGDTLNDNVEVGGLKLWLPDNPVPQRIVTSPLRLDTDNDGLKDGDEVRFDFKPKDISGSLQTTIRLDLEADGLYMPKYDPDIGKRVDTCNPTDPDTDKDGIPDGYEFDFSDPDCDGLPTYWEQEMGFGRLNAFKQDTDDNGIPDMAEDFDGDGFNNLEEYRHRTDPLEIDSPVPGLDAPPGMPARSHADNGIKDSDEGMLGADKSQPFKDQWGHPILLRQPIYSDSDGDMMPDWWEIVHKLNPKANDSGDDADNDGFANIDEYIYNTNPETADTDKDGTADWQDHPFTYSPYCTDRDRDGIGDWWEKYWFTSIEACDPSGNPDGPWDETGGLYGDNWTNFQEWYNPPAGWENNMFRTNPKINDTDGDGINDDFDPYPVRIPYVQSAMNPTDLGSSMNPVLRDPGEGDMDHDSMSNIDEYKYPFGTLDPTDPDSDQDLIPDGWEVAMGIPVNISGNGSGITNGTIDTIMKPLDGAGDTLTDPDIDGVNYSLKWVDLNGNRWPDSGEFIITEYDANGDGQIDPFFENESLSNMEEYWFGKDCDADGIMENTTYPFANDTDKDGMLDGYELGFSDADDDGMANIYEMKWGLNPLDPEGNNGSLADIDNDGFTNGQEVICGTNPRDPSDYPMIGRSGARGVPQSMRDAYEFALMLEKYLMDNPRVADPSFLQDIRAFLGHYR